MVQIVDFFFSLQPPFIFLVQQDPLDPYIEVLGCVDQDLTVTVERIVNYGTDFGGCGSNEFNKIICRIVYLTNFSPAPLQILRPTMK